MIPRRDEGRLASEKRRAVIRVPIPVDIGTVAATASSAFALATPLRVDELLRLAVYEALGGRAPQDKRDRSVAATLAGMRAGDFLLEVDGRRCTELADVVVCAGFATLRFFATKPLRRALRVHGKLTR